MTHKRINVLHVLVNLGGGGVETLLLNLQERLPKHITFDYLVACSDFRDKEAHAFGSTVHITPPEMQHPTRWAALVGNLVQECRYDVVQFHRFACSGAVLKAAKQAGATVRIAHLHRTNLLDASLQMRLFYLPYHWTFNRWLLLQHATHLIGCSSEALRYLAGPFEKNPKCRVVTNGILMDDFANKMGSASTAELCQRYGIPAGVPVIGNVARMTPVKNHELLLRIFHHLAHYSRTFADSVLFIGGDGPQRLALEQDCDRYGLQNRVFMPGHCTNVPEILGNLFDCFVSTSKMEGLPVSMIEAVAAGLHVVCADTITQDVARAFPGRFTMVPLSSPMERWVQAVEHAIRQRIPPEQGLELVRQSPMNFTHFADEMIKIYETAKEREAKERGTERSAVPR